MHDSEREESEDDKPSTCGRSSKELWAPRIVEQRSLGVSVRRLQTSKFCHCLGEAEI